MVKRHLNSRFIQASCSAALNNLTIGGVFEYNPVKDKTGNIHPIGQPANSGATTKLQNQMSISIVPGYAFTNDTLAFAKLGYFISTQSFANEDGTAGAPGNINRNRPVKSSCG